MAIRFRCPAGHKLTVSEDLAGRKVRCPTCNAKVVAPHESTADAEGEDPPVAAPPIAAPPVAPPPVAGSTPAAPNAPAAPTAPAALTPAPSAAAAVPFPDEAPAAPATKTPPAKDSASAGKSADNKQQPPAAAKKANPQAEDKTRPKGKQPKPTSAKASSNKPGASKQSPSPPQEQKSAGKASAVAVPFPEEEAASKTAPAKASLPFPDEAIGTSPAGPPSPLAPVKIITESPADAVSASRIQTTYLLSVAMAGVSLLAAAPALPHLNVLEAPSWALLVLAGALLHALYVVWVVSLPDWSTVWIGGYLFTATCASYLAAMLLILVSPGWLGLADQRGTAVTWSLVMSLLFAVIAFGCFRYGVGWRREFESNQLM